MTTTPKSGLRVPASGDAATVATYFQNLGSDLDWVGQNFATTSARDAANPSPAVGDECKVAGVKQVYYSSRWNTVLDDSYQWQTVTPAANFSASPVSVQARVFNGFVELKGIMRHASQVPTSFTLMGSSSTPLTAINTGYNSTTNGGITVGATGLDSTFTPAANVAITARTNGSLYIQAAATGVLYVNLAGIKFPL